MTISAVPRQQRPDEHVIENLAYHQADLAVQPLQELCLMMPADHRWDPRVATVFGGILRQIGRS